MKAKLSRLDELNILLNMDKTENEIVGGEPDEGENLKKQRTRAMKGDDNYAIYRTGGYY